MKKIISIVLGVAALAACTKTSVSYEQPGEIALAPVTRANMTKAAITGTTFPITNDMGVYAFYNTVDAGTPKANCKFSCLSEGCEICQQGRFR